MVGCQRTHVLASHLLKGQELLFDLGSDPRERDNRAAVEPDLLGRLRSLVSEYWAESPGKTGDARELIDEETVRQLRSLGYLR